MLKARLLRLIGRVKYWQVFALEGLLAASAIATASLLPTVSLPVLLPLAFVGVLGPTLALLYGADIAAERYAALPVSIKAKLLEPHQED